MEEQLPQFKTMGRSISARQTARNPVDAHSPSRRRDRRCLRQQLLHPEEPAVIDSLAFSADGTVLAGSACTNSRQVTDPQTAQVTQSCLQNTCFLWDVATGELSRQSPSDQASAILSMAFSPQDPNSLAVGYRQRRHPVLGFSSKTQPVGLPFDRAGRTRHQPCISPGWRYPRLRQ